MRSVYEAGRRIPRTRENHGAVHNNPDIPQPKVIDLREVSVFVPQNSKPNGASRGLLKTREATVIDRNGVVTRGTILVPQVNGAITPFFETHHGGRRTGGGGTSSKALERARKKARMNRARSR